jgi:hypothetical protein
MTPEQEAGLTKARLICNASRAAEDRFGTNEAYAKWVCEMAGLESLPKSALNSYAEQHSNRTVEELENLCKEV